MTTVANSEPSVWMVAHGSDGEYEGTALDQGIALLGFQQVPDLTDLNEGQIAEMIESHP